MAIPVPVTKTRISTTNWGIPITNEVNRMTPLVLASNPRGLVSYDTTGVDNAGHTANFEWGVALDIVVPANATNRKYRYEFGLALGATSPPNYPPTAGGYIWYTCNQGDKTGPELGRWICTAPQWNGFVNFQGSKILTGLTSGITIGAGIFFGSGGWTIYAESWAALYDIGGT